MKNRESIGAFIIRLVLGIIFIGHGLEKFKGGISNIVGWFDSIGLPGFLAYIVAGLELVGGIALVIGIGTRIVAALLALLLVGAIFKVQLAVGFIGGYAYDLALLAISVYLVINGSKLYSVDNYFFKKK